MSSQLKMELELRDELEQFKDKPYTLELRDEFTTGTKPKSLPTIRAMHYHGKPATRKVLEHFVRTTPVVEKCDDPRCFSRLVTRGLQSYCIGATSCTSL